MNAYKPVHDLAPIISIAVSLSTFAIIPFGKHDQSLRARGEADDCRCERGHSLSSLHYFVGVYGVTLLDGLSNNKYSLLGGLRSSAQMISYELSMGLSIIGVLMVSGTLRLDQIVLHQTNYLWGGCRRELSLQPVLLSPLL